MKLSLLLNEIRLTEQKAAHGIGANIPSSSKHCGYIVVILINAMRQICEASF